jgi:hypothetical protein
MSVISDPEGIVAMSGLTPETGCDTQSIRTPEGVQERRQHLGRQSPLRPTAGVESMSVANPRVFVAIAPRPKATISDPCRDQEAKPPGSNLQ